MADCHDFVLLSDIQDCLEAALVEWIKFMLMLKFQCPCFASVTKTTHNASPAHLGQCAFCQHPLILISAAILKTFLLTGLSNSVFRQMKSEMVEIKYTTT